MRDGAAAEDNFIFLKKMNHLDQAVMAMQRSQAGAPELYRQLTKGELCFLLPFHPEMVEGGRMSLESGSPFPFCVQADPDGNEVVPIFSSAARLEEGLRAANAPLNTFLCGTMRAEQVLEVIGKSGFPAVLNRGCTTGEITLPPELLCDLADGSIFQSPGPRETKQAAVTTLNPADYPTDLIQRTFEFIRHHLAFRAAWVFLLPDDAAVSPGAQKYQLLVLLAPASEALLHDLNLALQSSPPKGLAFDVGAVDATDTVQVMTLFAKAQPFYLAPDFHHPPAE
jgi:hypothetical protein